MTNTAFTDHKDDDTKGDKHDPKEDKHEGKPEHTDDTHTAEQKKDESQKV